MFSHISNVKLLSSSWWARYEWEKSCLSKTVCLVHLYKVTRSIRSETLGICKLWQYNNGLLLPLLLLLPLPLPLPSPSPSPLPLPLLLLLLLQYESAVWCLLCLPAESSEVLHSNQYKLTTLGLQMSVCLTCNPMHIDASKLWSCASTSYAVIRWQAGNNTCVTLEPNP